MVDYMSSARPRRSVLAPSQGLYQPGIRQGQIGGPPAPIDSAARPGQPVTGGAPQQQPQQGGVYNASIQQGDQSGGVREAGSLVKRVGGTVDPATTTLLPKTGNTRLDTAQGLLRGYGPAGGPTQGITDLPGQQGGYRAPLPNTDTGFATAGDQNATIEPAPSQPQGQSEATGQGLAPSGGDPNAAGYQGHTVGEKVMWPDSSGQEQEYSWDGTKWTATGTQGSENAPLNDQAGKGQGQSVTGFPRASSQADDLGFSDFDMVSPRDGFTRQGKDGNWYTYNASTDSWGQSDRSTDRANQLADSLGTTPEAIQELWKNGYTVDNDGTIRSSDATTQGQVGDPQDPVWNRADAASQRTADKNAADAQAKKDADFQAGLEKRAQDAMNLDVPQLDEKALTEQINAQRQQRALELSNAMAAFNSQGSRLGLSPEQMAAAGQQTQYQAGTEGRNEEAKTRLTAAMTNMSAQLAQYQNRTRLIEQLMSMTNDAHTLEVLQQQREQMLGLEQKSKEELLRYQHELNKPGIGDVLGGFGMNLLGGLGSLGLGALGGWMFGGATEDPFAMNRG